MKGKDCAFTDGEFEGVGWMKAHSVAVCTAQRSACIAGELLVLSRRYFVQERIVVTQKL